MSRSLPLGLALILLLSACGERPSRVKDEGAPPGPETRGEPASAGMAEPAPHPESASAFRLAEAPDSVHHSLDRLYFRKGIPRPDPRDAIPAFLDPRLLPAKDFTMRGKDPRVIVVQVGEDVHAYPIYILDLHELVNDVVGTQPVLVSWCPLCGSAVTYARRVGKRTLTFGVSGYLFKSDVLMYDHQTETFWSQLQLEAVAGPLTGTKLEVLPSTVMTFEALKKRHPDAPVLMEDPELWTKGSYKRSPYAGYEESKRIWFPVGRKSPLLFPKAEVVGVVRPGGTRAYALEGLRKLEQPLEDTLGGERLSVAYDADADEVIVTTSAGDAVRPIRLFWFAWYAFHPDTDLWRSTARPIAVATPK